MDYETVPAEDFGASLQGLGINLLVTDVKATAAFLADVFGMGIHRRSDDFAIVTYGNQVFQLHADATDHSNPLQGLLPEPPRVGQGWNYAFVKQTQRPPWPKPKPQAVRSLA